MDWIIGFIGLAVGTVIGFFVAKYVNFGGTKANRKMSEQEIKQLLAQQANAYINQSRQSLQSVQKQLQELQTGLNNYEGLLNNEEASSRPSGINYFDEQASTYLRNKQSAQKREKVKAETQPLDFSNESSGLFDGTKTRQALENKS